MQNKNKDQSENYFVSNRRRGIIIVDFWFLGICNQTTFEAVDNSVFILCSLVYPATAYCFFTGGNSTGVHVYLLTKLASFSRIESIPGTVVAIPSPTVESFVHK
jgi:hypothetical protein